MKIVKNNKFARLPRANQTVKETLRRAEIFAEKEGWKKIIIIGEGSVARGLYSKMSSYIAIGMLECEKADLLKDILK